MLNEIFKDLMKTKVSFFTMSELIFIIKNYDFKERFFPKCNDDFVENDIVMKILAKHKIAEEKKQYYCNRCGNILGYEEILETHKDFVPCNHCNYVSSVTSVSYIEVYMTNFKNLKLIGVNSDSLKRKLFKKFNECTTIDFETYSMVFRCLREAKLNKPLEIGTDLIYTSHHPIEHAKGIMRGLGIIESKTVTSCPNCGEKTEGDIEGHIGRGTLCPKCQIRLPSIYTDVIDTLKKDIFKED